MRLQIVVGSTALVLLGTVTAYAQPFALVDAACRQAIGKGAQKLADTIIKEKAKCEQLRLRQKLNATTVCNDLADPSFPGAAKVAASKEKMFSGVVKGCVGAQDPQHNGYVVCPAPCQSIPITVYESPVSGTANSVAHCIECITGAVTTDAIGQTYGNSPNPTVPSDTKDPKIKCYNFIATGLRKYFSARVKSEQKCQFQADQSPGPDCKAQASADTKVAKQLVKLKLLIAKCDPNALSTFSSCGSDVTGEQNCIQTAADTDMDNLFTAIYIPPNGVFVSSTAGTPGGDGTIFSPIDTINGGIALATPAKNTLFIDGGAYPESVNLASNVVLEGGFDHLNGWVRDGATVSVFGANTGALVGNSVNNVVVDSLNFSAGGNAAVGGSSYGARFVSSTNVTIKNSSITAGNGGPGSTGSNGSVGAGGGGAGNGGNGCEDSTTLCSSCSRPGGGGGGSNGSCSGANGGNGGQPGDPTTGNSSGDGGGSSAGPGGGGGGGGSLHSGGGQGGNGLSGTNGLDGAGGLSSGSFGSL